MSPQAVWKGLSRQKKRADNLSYFKALVFGCVSINSSINYTDIICPYPNMFKCGAHTFERIQIESFYHCRGESETNKQKEMWILTSSIWQLKLPIWTIMKQNKLKLSIIQKYSCKVLSAYKAVVRSYLEKNSEWIFQKINFI